MSCLNQSSISLVHDCIIARLLWWWVLTVGSESCAQVSLVILVSFLIVLS